VGSEDTTGATLPNLLEALSFDQDTWADANMQSVQAYLRGSRSLNVPSELRCFLHMDS
jgi:hypothetical protein